jgi:hypothetical protein
MAKHKKKDKDKKKQKNAATAAASQGEELQRLRDENEELRDKLAQIAELAHFDRNGREEADDMSGDDEDVAHTEGVHPL